LTGCFSLLQKFIFSLLSNDLPGDLQISNLDKMLSIKRNLPVPVVFARELRKNQTPEEKIIWDKLRDRRLLGYKFLRQHPITTSSAGDKFSFFIADFYCAEKKLVVEIAGLIHTSQKDYDIARDIVMNEMELTVIRLKNEEINKDVYQALAKLKQFLRQKF
jgi:very-short-patch-repair endonuclease